jgi:serine/threonine-protein kinase
VSGMTLKLIDFGSALYLDELEANQKYMGTRGYAAPELFKQNKIDERCDVYGIGILMYYMAAGRAVKDTNTGMDNIDQVGNCSKKLKNIINNCLRYNPSQRFASVTRLSKQLSAMVRNNQLQFSQDRTVIYAIAGAQNRIGVTHFAFRLCNFFTSKDYSCIYQEMNDSGCVYSMKSRYVGVTCSGGFYEIHGIPMLEYRKELSELLEKYQVKVLDYGCLTKENLQHFLEAQVKLVVMGAKDWELENSENLLKMTAEYKDITYLFNFLDGKQFQKVVKSMNFRSCCRIPYEPDPYAKAAKKNGLELFEDLTGRRKKLKRSERVSLNTGG